MKKVMLMFFLMIIVFNMASCNNSTTNKIVKNNQEVANVKIGEISYDNIESEIPVMFDASYSDGVSSLLELKAKSYAIIKAKVISQEHFSSFTTLSHLEVIEIFSGNVQKDIVLYQLGRLEYDDDVLSDGEYVLFLGKQESDLYKDNAYYIISGTEGIFKIENQNIVYKGNQLRKEFDKNNFDNLNTFIEWISRKD